MVRSQATWMLRDKNYITKTWYLVHLPLMCRVSARAAAPASSLHPLFSRWRRADALEVGGRVKGFQGSCRKWVGLCASRPAALSTAHG